MRGAALCARGGGGPALTLIAAGPYQSPVTAAQPGPSRPRRGRWAGQRLCQPTATWRPRRFFSRALRTGAIPAEVTTDRAAVYPRVIDELIPSALHTVEQYANNPVEAGHGRLKARLRPMRGLKRHRSARILTAGHAFVQNLRRGHYDIAMDVPACHRLRVAFGDLATTI